MQASNPCAGGTLVWTEQRTGLPRVWEEQDRLGGGLNLPPENLGLQSNGAGFMSHEDSLTIPPARVCVCNTGTVLSVSTYIISL